MIDLTPWIDNLIYLGKALPVATIAFLLLALINTFKKEITNLLIILVGIIICTCFSNLIPPKEVLENFKHINARIEIKSWQPTETYSVKNKVAINGYNEA